MALGDKGYVAATVESFEALTGKPYEFLTACSESSAAEATRSKGPMDDATGEDGETCRDGLSPRQPAGATGESRVLLRHDVSGVEPATCELERNATATVVPQAPPSTSLGGGSQEPGKYHGGWRQECSHSS